MVFEPIMLLKSLYFTRLGLCPYRKLLTNFSEEAKIKVLALPGDAYSLSV